MKYSTRAEYWVDPKSGIPRYEFNELYQDYSDPWGCGKDFNSIVNRLFLEILFPPSKFYKSFLDIGCGTGELTNFISCRNDYGKLKVPTFEKLVLTFQVLITTAKLTQWLIGNT